MPLEYFPCYHSYLKKIAKLSDQEVGRLFRALLIYSETEETQELTGRESVAFDFIADDIDRAKKSYKERCQKNRDNVNKRYDNISDDTNVYERIQSNTNAYESYQNKDKDKNKDKSNKKENKQKKNFVAPTVQEIREYCQLRGNDVDPQKFFDYFSSSGWIDSTGKPVKNWKQKIITWEGTRGNQPQKPNEIHGDANYSPNLADMERMQRMLKRYGD